MPLRLIGGRDRDGAEPRSDDAPAGGKQPSLAAQVVVIPRPVTSPQPAAATRRGSGIAPDQTIIGPHLTLNGNLRGGDDIAIHGVMHGNIRGRRVEICRGARVEGDIVAAEAIIAGAVRGNVEANRIEIMRGGGVEGRLENDGSCEISGELEGDINSRDVVVGLGAKVNSVITADRARVAGTVTGVIEAEDMTIEDSARITGEIDSNGPIDIYGHVEGKVRGKRIHIREGAIVAENIYAEEITIAGTATGELMAISVAISATAHVDGQIVHHQIEIAQGAVVRGSRPWRPKQYLQQRDRAGTSDTSD